MFLYCRISFVQLIRLKLTNHDQNDLANFSPCNFIASSFFSLILERLRDFVKHYIYTFSPEFVVAERSYISALKSLVFTLKKWEVVLYVMVWLPEEHGGTCGERVLYSMSCVGNALAYIFKQGWLDTYTTIRSHTPTTRGRRITVA